LEIFWHKELTSCASWAPLISRSFQNTAVDRLICFNRSTIFRFSTSDILDTSKWSDHFAEKTQ
jgi:hypothetical protein